MPGYAYKTNILREPKEIFYDEVSFDINYVSLDEAIQTLTNLRDNLPENTTKATVVVDDDSGDGQYVRVYRKETPAEVAARVERQEEYNRKVAEQERQRYLELKEQFGD